MNQLTMSAVGRAGNAKSMKAGIAGAKSVATVNGVRKAAPVGSETMYDAGPGWRSDLGSARPDKLLAPHRILDLTDERGLITGHTLAQLRADVLRVVPTGGSPARRVPPFDEHEGKPRTSLFRASFTAGNRRAPLALDANERCALAEMLNSSTQRTETLKQSGALV